MFRNSHHFREVFKNWSGCYTDPLLLEYFSKKSIHTWYHDPPQYNYWFIMCWSVGLCAATALRHFLFNPDVHFRRAEKRKNFVDRWQHHLYSLPYYNHHLRNISLIFTGTLIDNDADWLCDPHPWGIHPTRSVYYARFPFFFCAEKYFVDNPNHYKCTYEYNQKRYKEIGYLPDTSAIESEE